MFNELIDASNTSLKEGLFTALPAVIIKVHSGNELRYDIQPTISQKNKDGEDKPYTAIYHVPAALPKSVTGGLSFELSVGDGVLAIFSQRGLEAWKSSNSASSINKRNDYAIMNMKDAVIIPCVFPFSASPNNNNPAPEDTVLNCKSTEVRIEKGSGNVVVNTGTEVIVNANKTTNNSNTFYTKNVDVSGDVSVGGSFTVSGDITVGGDIICTGNVYAKAFIQT